MKDAATIVANDESDIYINTVGTSALAKGGSGDVSRYFSFINRTKDRTT